MLVHTLLSYSHLPIVFIMFFTEPSLGGGDSGYSHVMPPLVSEIPELVPPASPITHEYPLALFTHLGPSDSELSLLVNGLIPNPTTAPPVDHNTITILSACITLKDVFTFFNMNNLVASTMKPEKQAGAMKHFCAASTLSELLSSLGSQLKFCNGHGANVFLPNHPQGYLFIVEAVFQTCQWNTATHNSVMSLWYNLLNMSTMTRITHSLSFVSIYWNDLIIS
jgi:hypothetical protein